MQKQLKENKITKDGKLWVLVKDINISNKFLIIKYIVEKMKILKKID